MADATETNASSETHALRNDLEQLRKDFTNLSDDIKHSSDGQVQAGMSKARSWGSELCSEAESRPLTCIVSAFGVGLVLGKLFGR